MRKHDIEKRVEELEGYSGDYQAVTLSELLSFEWEVVDEQRNLYRTKENGRVYRHPDGAGIGRVLKNVLEED